MLKILTESVPTLLKTDGDMVWKRVLGSECYLSQFYGRLFDSFSRFVTKMEKLLALKLPTSWTKKTPQ